MSVVSGSAVKIGRVVLELWERGLYFFWAVACASAAMFIVLMAASWFRPGSGPNVFKTYGWLPLTVAIWAAILGIGRKLEERPTPTVFLVGNAGSELLGAVAPEGRPCDHTVPLPHACDEPHERPAHWFDPTGLP
jgi:hypothetical protein